MESTPCKFEIEEHRTTFHLRILDKDMLKCEYIFKLNFKHISVHEGKNTM